MRAYEAPPVQKLFWGGSVPSPLFTLNAFGVLIFGKLALTFGENHLRWDSS